MNEDSGGGLAAGRKAPGSSGAKRTDQLEGRGSRTASPKRGLLPCLAYLFIEFGRPMAWIAPFGLLRPGMLVGIWAFAATLSRGLRRPIPRPLMYMLGLLVLMAFHVPFAMNNAWAFSGFQAFAILVLGGVFPLAMLPSTFDEVRHVATAYVLFHVPTAIHALLFSGRGLEGWMGDENDLALALNAATAVGLYLVNDAKTFARRALLGSTLGLLVAGVVASKSRGGFVGLAALGMYSFIAGPRRGRILIAAVAATLCLWAFAPSQYWQEIRSIAGAGQKGDTGEARLYLWKIGWRMFLDHPIVGVGTLNYGIRAPEYEDAQRATFEGDHVWGRACHSLYFTLMPEQGFIGVALFTALIVWCVRAFRRLRREARSPSEDPVSVSAGLVGSGLMAGIVATLVSGAFLSVLYYPVLWVLAGLLAALDAVRAQERRNTCSESLVLDVTGRRQISGSSRHGGRGLD